VKLLTENYVEIELTEEVRKKLQDSLKEFKEKGTKLKSGRLIKTENDVLTYLLDLYEDKYGKLI
jgi:hypothetical protein